MPGKSLDSPSSLGVRYTGKDVTIIELKAKTVNRTFTEFYSCRVSFLSMSLLSLHIAQRN